MKLYFFVIKYNESLSRHRKHINIYAYKNKLFLVTSCFGMW